MSGTQPKQGIGFELLVAAELKSEDQLDGSNNINLQDYLFNVNPVEYPSRITGAPYSVSIDVTATSGERTYLIECKSSLDSDAIMKPKSRQFLEAILEFLALESFREATKWDLRFLLALNYPAGEELKQLIRMREAEDVKRLLDSLIKEGKRRYEHSFDPSFITTERLTATLANLALLELPDKLLRTRLGNDPRFQNAYEALSKQLRSTPEMLVQSHGGSLVERYGRITLGCSSNNHRECDEEIIDGTVCHIKNADTLVRDILEKARSRNSAIVVLGRKERGYSATDITWSNNLSSESVSKTLTACLNRLSEQNEGRNLLLYVVPGLFDLLAVRKNELATRISGSLSAESGKYHLDSISELNGLGDNLKIELARLILSDCYGFQTGTDTFESAEEPTGEQV